MKVSREQVIRAYSLEEKVRGRTITTVGMPVLGERNHERENRVVRNRSIITVLVHGDDVYTVRNPRVL